MIYMIQTNLHYRNWTEKGSAARPAGFENKY
jgi:hypothetical protein